MNVRQPLLLGLAFTVAAVLGGCGETPEHRLQRAEIAMANNKPDTALELAEDLLQANPADVKAMMIKARAQMQILQLDAARKTIEKLIEAQKDSGDARRMLINWAFLRMDNLLGQSRFANDEQAQAAFTEALDVGRAQADWIRVHESNPVEASFFQARFLLADADRLNVVLNSKRNLARSVKLPGDLPDPAADELKQLGEQIRSRRAEAEALYQQVIQGDPRYGNAVETYARMLVTQTKWPELWVMAQQLAQTQTLPASGASEAVLGLLVMPDSFQDTASRLDLAQKIQDNVDPAKKESVVWKISSARLCLKRNEPDKARPLLEQVLRVSPKHNMARFLLAQCLYRQQDYPQAKQILDSLSLELKNSSEVQTIYGLVLEQTGNPEMAKEALRKAIDLDPDNKVAHVALLQVMNREGQPERVSADINTYYDRNPSVPDAIRMKIQHEQSQVRPEGVRKVLERTETLSPLTVEHLQILIDGFLSLGDGVKAEKYARELASRNPDSLDAALRLAEAMMIQGRDADVKTAIEGIRKRFPESASIDQLLGQLYLRRQQFDLATVSLKAAVAAEPANVAAKILLARALAAGSFNEEALEQVEAAMEHDPANIEAKSLAYRIHQSLGRTEDANRYLSEIDASQIGERANPALLAQFRLREGNIDEAANICNRAVAAGNPDPTLRLLLAEIYTRKKEPSLVEKHLLALVNLQPQSARAFMELAMFYVRQGDPNKGMVELKKLQRVNEVLSQLALATVLSNTGKSDDAVAMLTQLVPDLVKRKDRMVLPVADMLSLIHRQRKDLDAAGAVYTPLVQADFLRAEASMRQIDLASPKDGPDTTVRRLDAVAKDLGADQHRMRYELLRRYVLLGRTERAMTLLDGWIADQPGVPLLMRWKGDLYRENGRFQEAIDSYNKVVKMAPDNVQIRLRVAQTYLSSFNYPAAEAAFAEMGDISQEARMLALAEMGHMFVGLGLNRQAADAFDRLEREGQPKEARIIHAMGRAMAALGRDDQARLRLAQVPSYSADYAPAQVLLSRLEVRAGLIDAARQRLDTLARDPRYAGEVATQLLNTDLRQTQGMDMFTWVDPALAMDALSETQRGGWLQLRIAASDRRGDWQGLLGALDAFRQFRPDSMQVAAARVLVLHRLERRELARQVYVNHKGLSSSPYGPLLAVMLGEPPAKVENLPPLPTYITALAQGDLAAARAAAEKMPPYRTIFGSDLVAMLDRPDAGSKAMAAAASRLAAAMVAYEVQLPRLAALICGDVVGALPGMIAAHAILTQATIDLNEPTQAVRTELQRIAPNSGLLLFLEARQKDLDKDPQGAAERLKALMAREPNNFIIGSGYAQLLQLAGEHDQAIAALEKAYASPSPDHVNVSNDLAYLLAERKPQRMAEAYSIAQTAYGLSKNNPALLDTLGWIEHLQGQNDKAILRLGQAVISLSQLPEVHYHIGAVYHALGNARWARYHLEEAAAASSQAPFVAAARKLLESLPTTP